MKLAKYFFGIFLLFNLQLAEAQDSLQIQPNGEDTTSIAALPQKAIDIDAGMITLIAPIEVDASDGLYDRFIKVVWKSQGKGKFYKVYRGEKGEIKKMKEVSNGWKKSNWMIDNGNLEKGKKYFYRVVMGINSQDISDFSDADSGYTKASIPMATGKKDDVVLIPDPLIRDSISMKMLHFSPSIPRAGDTLFLGALLKNQEEYEIENISIAYYLSKEELPGDQANLLFKEEEKDWKSAVFVRRSYHIPIPADTPSGSYYLVAIAENTKGAFRQILYRKPLRILEKR